MKSNILIITIIVLIVILGGITFAVILNNSNQNTSSSTAKNTLTLSPTSQSQSYPKSPTNLTASPTTDNRCIITISNQRYDVTEFRNSHPGGNIFRCGNDMTRDFFGQHGNTQLQQIQQYKID